MEDGDPRAGLGQLFAEVGRRVVASERGEAPSDAAIFAWSAVSPASWSAGGACREWRSVSKQ
jgi:hypothetical protein